MSSAGEASATRSLSVAVFIDWQNTYRGAREAFNLQNEGPIAGNIDPWNLGRALAGATDPTRAKRQLAEVRVYQGRPVQDRDPKTYAAHRAQCAVWEAGGGRLAVKHRALRYPPPYVANVRPREKGVDVMLAIELVQAAIREEFDRVVVVSTDTDLLPALELAADLRGEAFVEVAGWEGPGASAALLRVRGHHVRRIPMRRQVYERLVDRTDYTRPASERVLG